MPNKIKILETPRDGLQGLKQIIPTHKKIEFINQLLRCGFNSVEVGSIVSPNAIPQMADTLEILEKLDYSGTKSRIAVLVANKNGGKKAMDFDIIDDLIFPFSISESFMKRNINQGFEEAEKTVDDLMNLCMANNKTLIPYLSMGFGNPYGDEWSLDILRFWTEKYAAKGIKIIPVSDIMGEALPDKIEMVFSSLIKEYPEIEFGFHLHSEKHTAKQKIDAAYRAGIRRFDTVLGGLGGCPMTGKELIGNLDLSILANYCEENEIETGLNKQFLKTALQLNSKLISFVI
jgi:hydroxymethylglutaryl-CoA lyase